MFSLEMNIGELALVVEASQKILLNNRHITKFIVSN